MTRYQAGGGPFSGQILALDVSAGQQVRLEAADGSVHIYEAQGSEIAGGGAYNLFYVGLAL